MSVRPRLRLAVTATLAAIAALAASPPPRAAEDGPGSPGFGRQLTLEICGECHRVAANQTPVEDVAPDLTERMRDPGITELALRGYLRTSHPVMPNIRLTREQTDDVVAYLLTLKTAPDSK